ncbi:hypothetical protein [Streptomyces orinoci]|uniref:Permease n=1 Tax=Streptomyces orinoci TaxID=67339 RepID=A0ABV3K078_STRON|nr:hypothetical protein [Streptomyces orinoci]
MALALAAAMLALGFSSVIAVYASYQGIEERTAARAVQYAGAPDRKPVAMLLDGFDDVDGLQHSVVYLRPAGPGVPPPPGVRRWPAPGEAVLSPKLAELLEARGAKERFGKVEGKIADSGLASPGEELAYVNPTESQFRNAKFRQVFGFGKPGQGIFGDPLFIKERSRLLNALYLFLVPAAVLAVVAARMGSSGRDKRTALVSALGGGWRARLWLNLGESTSPVLLGALMGSLPGIAVALTADVRLPWIDYWMSSSDLRHWLWALACAGGAAVVLLLGLVCVLHRAGSKRAPGSTRLSARRGQALRWAALACPLLVFATVWGPEQLDPEQYGDLRRSLYNAGVAAVLLTLPCAVAVVVMAAGGRLASSARRTGQAGALVAGRDVAKHPGTVARLVAGVGIAMVAVSQVQLTSVQFSASAAAARQTAARIGKSVLVMELRPNRVEKTQLDDVLRRLPPETQTLALIPAHDPGTGPLLRGSCSVLTALRLGCPAERQTFAVPGPNPRVAEAVRWTGPMLHNFEVQQGAPLQDWPKSGVQTLLLASAHGRDLPVDDIKQLVRDRLPVASGQVDVPGASWLQGANLGAAHGRWVKFLGVPGVFILGLAFVLSSLAEFVRFSAFVAPLSVLTGRRRIFYSTALWSLLAPMLVAIGASFVVSDWLAAPQEDPVKGIQLSTSMLATTAASLASLALLAWWWGGRSAIRLAGRWRPYGE